MTRRWMLGVLAVVLLVAGGLTWRRNRSALPESMRVALEDADGFELLSLDPSFIGKFDDDDAPRARTTDAELASPTDYFHHHRILGRKSIADVAMRRRLVDALEAGVRASDGRVAACFSPRHGLRLTRAGQSTDLVICFECEQTEMFSKPKSAMTIPTTREPTSAFNQALRDVGLPLAPGPDE